jgi:hypothetical protein
MSTIRHQNIFQHMGLGTLSGTQASYTSNEDGYSSQSIERLTSSPVTIDLGTILTPKFYQFRLMSGDDALISFDNGVTWPFRLSGANDMMTGRINIEDLREISTITCAADSSRSLSGDYFDLTDRTGTVRVWFWMAARAEVSTCQCVADVADSLDGTYFDVYDSAGPVRVWYNTGAGAGAPAVPGGGRLLEVTIATNDSAAVVAAATTAILDAEAEFAATDDGIDTVTITASVAGTRSNIAAGTSGFTVAVSIQGDNASSAPATPGGGRLVQVDIAENDTAVTIAAALAAALEADDEYEAVSDGVSLVTVTDIHIGTRTDIVDGTTGWTLANPQDGAAGPTVKMKSAGTSNVSCTVLPF